jgi:PKD repeat protein
MRKFYSLLIFLNCLLFSNIDAQNLACGADFSVESSSINSSVSKLFIALPVAYTHRKPAKICWTFGDGRDICVEYTSSFSGHYTVTHNYAQPGEYKACMRMVYSDGCVAEKCKVVVIEKAETACTAEIKIESVSNSNLVKKFFALPVPHTQRKPAKICWTFGDGKDTCVEYSSSFSGSYSVTHTYARGGEYKACFRMVYSDGCVAENCKAIEIQRTENTCSGDIKVESVIGSSHVKKFFALPVHTSQRKPAKICWTFGDGKDTCIEYSASFSGHYSVTHAYARGGEYKACYRMVYSDGCVAENCKAIEIQRTENACTAEIKIESVSNSNLVKKFFALPVPHTQRKPAKICWTFGDGKDTCVEYSSSFSGSYSVTHIYARGGEYKACFRMVYSDGCVAEKCKVVVIEKSETACKVKLEVDHLASSKLTKKFIVVPAHHQQKKPTKICWTFGDGKQECKEYSTTYTGQYNINHTYSKADDYKVCIRVVYADGCVAEECKAIIVEGDKNTCNTELKVETVSNHHLSKKITVLPSGDKKPVKICWTFGDGKQECKEYNTTFTGSYTINYTYPKADDYKICTRVVYADGCVAENCKTVEIEKEESVCSVNIEIESVNTLKLTKKFFAIPVHNSQKKPSKICWSFGDGRDTCIQYNVTFSGHYTVSHTYSRSGEYKACLRMVYADGCVAEKCSELKVITDEHSPTSECNVILKEMANAETNLRRYFTIAPTLNRQPEKICLRFGDGTDTCFTPANPVTLQSLSISHQFPAPGVYHINTRIWYAGGCIAEHTKEVVIRSTSNICGGYLIDSLSAPNTISFRGVGIHNNNDRVVSYRWTFGDGRTGTGQQVVHKYEKSGKYEACLYLRTDRGCESRICKPVIIEGTHSQQRLQLSPNPANEVLHAVFISTKQERVSVYIFNANGVLVKSFQRNVVVGNNNWNFDVSTLPTGAYSVVVRSTSQLASAVFLR